MIECVVRGVPPGLGEPVFDKLEADLAKAMLSLPATKGFEIGSGFAGRSMKGSEHNDPFEMREGKVRTATNRSGGVQGGISNGENIIFRVAFKPTATIAREQKTVTSADEETTLRGARPPRSLCPAARRADGRGHGGARPLRPRPAPASIALIMSGAGRTNRDSPLLADDFLFLRPHPGRVRNRPRLAARSR